MSVIQNNGFPSGFAGANVPEFEPAGSSYRSAAQAAPSNYDLIAPIANQQSPAATRYGGYGGYNDGGGLSGFTNIMNGFLNGLQNLLASLCQQFGLGNGSSGSGTPGAGGQQLFRSATAASTGDPHETFNATSGSGNTLNGTWDSMQSHSNLLNSDSFNGGYQVSTVVTEPSANGVTLNERATIATSNGATQVTMDKDGSYAVSSNGQNVALQTGQAVALGNGESVTLNGDKSLTERDANGSGGTISTTLRSNGAGGVDVSNIASNVDLGGYLVNRSDDHPVEDGGTAGTPSVDPYAQPAPTPSGPWSWQQPLDGAQYNDTAEQAEFA